MAVPEQGSLPPDSAGPKRTSRLAIAAFVLALFPVCLNLVGIVLGIIAAVGISRNKATRGGLGLAIAAIGIGAAWIPIAGILSAIAIPNFIRFQARAKQSEAKSNLSLLYVAEEAWAAEAGGYSEDFEKIGFYPGPDNRYAYFLGGSSVPVGHPEADPVSLPPDLQTGITEGGFLGAAVGNLDGDATLDVWVIDQERQLEHRVDDVHE